MHCAPRVASGARHENGSALRPLAPLSAWVSLLTPFFFAAGCGDPGPEDAAAAGHKPSAGVVVEVAVVEPGPLTLEVSLTGQLEAEYAVVVRPELEGVIRSIEFDEGKPVEQGDVLFRLRDEEQIARLHEAQAAERLALDVFERTRRLTSQDISSMARRTEAAAALDEVRAKLELAQIDLDRTRIRAPFDGVAGSLMVGPGEWVKPETGLVSIEAVEKLQIVIAIPESGIALARIGGKIHLRVVSYPGERFAGEVFFISPSVDRATRRLIIKAWVSNEDHRLKPGMFANVDVVVFEKGSALTVPEAALVYDRHGIYVWRVDPDGRAEKVPVEMGIRQKGRVEILVGLEAQDRVISAGVNKVRAGDLVEAIGPDVREPSPGVEDGTVIRASGQARGRADGVEG